MAVYITIPWLSSSPHPKKKTNKQRKIKKKKKKRRIRRRRRENQGYLMAKINDCIIFGNFCVCIERKRDHFALFIY